MSHLRKQSNPLRLFLLAGPLFCISAYLVADAERVRESLSIFRRKVSGETKNSLLLGERAKPGAIQFSIQPLEEFDFLTREEIFKKRELAVSRGENLLARPYAPSEEVFGQVEDKKAWWGIEGIFKFGPGAQGNSGLSEEARYVMNPFLLVGLVERNAYIVKNPSSIDFDPYPKAIGIEIEPRERRGRVRYDLNGYRNFLKVADKTNLESTPLDLVLYNARDLGFRFFSIDEKASSGIRWDGRRESSFPLLQFLHTGPSCGMPGGCNNMSPMLESVKVSLLGGTGRIAVKLWKDEPADVHGTADIDFTIEF